MLLSHHSQLLELGQKTYGVIQFQPVTTNLDGATWYIGFNSVCLDTNVPLSDIYLLETTLVHNSTRIFTALSSYEPLHIIPFKTSTKDITPEPTPDVPDPPKVYRHIAYKQLDPSKLFKINSITNPIELRIRPLQPLYSTFSSDTIIHLHVSLYKT